MSKEYSFPPSIMAHSMQYEIEHTIICKENSDPIKKKNPVPLLCGSSPECLSSPFKEVKNFTNFCQ